MPSPLQDPHLRNLHSPYGYPTTPLAHGAKEIALGCATRICNFTPPASAIRLANGATSFSKGNLIITLKNETYLVRSKRETL